MEKKKYSIRKVEEKDAKELLAIYAPFVENTAITFEYDVPTEKEFLDRIQKITKKYPYLVAESDGEILGYAYANTFKNRAAYDWSVELSIYIKKEEKHQGIGRRLYEELEKKLKEQGIQNLYACVACVDEEDEYLTNDSIYFHKKMGYRLIGEFKKCGLKFGRWYNMVWLEKMIGTHECIL